ncbi:MAG: sarcosine oxidase subunit gamma [Ascidiaceihabitans sp.]|nr:sarcosine oxidase subunit gamma [Ascidiaceihabitans sp.]
MHDLTPITALGGTNARVETIGAVTCSEVPDVALASVTARLGKESQTRTAVKKIIKADAPDVSRFDGGDVLAFWAGPEQWMLEAPFDSHEDIAARVKSVCKTNASVVEQTDAWARFDISGAEVLAVMELLCNANSRAMDVGACTRSSVHHLGCFVLRRAPEMFSIYGPRASAGSLLHAIITAMHTVA